MTEQEIEIEDPLLVIKQLRAALTAANAKLFEAGKFAGQQQALIDELRTDAATLETAMTAALHHLEKAHQAVHHSDRMACLQAIADAMEALG